MQTVTTESPICKLENVVLQKLQSRHSSAPEFGAPIATGACDGAIRAIMEQYILLKAFRCIVVACVENPVA